MPSWVYEILHKATKECIYVGSATRKYFCQRKGDHTKPITSKKRPKLPLYKFVSDSGGWDQFSFNIIHERPDMDKIDLLNLEKQEIELRKPRCNINSPITTKEERLAMKRVDQKNWRTNNPEKTKERGLINREREEYKEQVKVRCSTRIDCPCGGTYTLQNKTLHCKTHIHQSYIILLE